jgi:hypothetical protein
LDRVRLFLDSLNYTYIEGFSRVRDPLTARHNVCGNIRENRLKNFKDQDCPYCAEKGVSKIELEILEWVRTFYPEAKKYYIKKKPDEVATGRKLEIDIYIEEIGLGIEYCGLHWHSENYNIMDMTAEQLHEESEESKHYKKMLRAKENGIRVITVFGNEWHHREEQVRAYIQSAMGKNTIKIHGRKTEVRPIDKHVADDFFEKYHIQGKEPHSFLFWGLFHKNELVGAISAGRHPQRASEYPHSLCLNRMAFKAQTTVVGGANKLFQALKKQAIKMKYRDIMSWSDNKWSEGDIYKKLGFEFSSEKEKGLSRGLSDGSIFPECFYVKGLNLLSRSAAKRQGLESKLKIIWDCGKKRWVYSL